MTQFFFGVSKESAWWYCLPNWASPEVGCGSVD